MYSKKETIELKQAFWTALGQYMQPVLSADGEHINWINYKTGEKDIYFRMNADNKSATIGIELTHKDIYVQSLIFDQFDEVKKLLHQTLNEEWQWLRHVHDENEKTISTIKTTLENVSVLNKQDWPQMISFFKPRIIALDEFWSQAKYIFEEMR